MKELLENAELNTETSASLGKYSAFAINFNPTKKEYSWTLYYEEDNQLHPVQPKRIIGEIKCWESKEEAVENLNDFLEERVIY